MKNFLLGKANQDSDDETIDGVRRTLETAVRRVQTPKQVMRAALHIRAAIPARQHVQLRLSRRHVRH